MSGSIAGHNVSSDVLEQFEKKDVELTVPKGAPRPVLVIVMVSLRATGREPGLRSSMVGLDRRRADSVGSCILVCPLTVLMGVRRWEPGRSYHLEALVRARRRW